MKLLRKLLGNEIVDFLAGKPWWGRVLTFLFFMTVTALYTAAAVLPKLAKRALYNFSAKYWHILYPLAWWN